MTSYGVCMLYDISIEIFNPEIGAQLKKILTPWMRKNGTKSTWYAVYVHITF